MSVLNLILAHGSRILDIWSSTGMLDICECFRKSQEFFLIFICLAAPGLSCGTWDR